MLSAMSEIMYQYASATKALVGIHLFNVTEELQPDLSKSSSLATLRLVVSMLSVLNREELPPVGVSSTILAILMLSASQNVSPMQSVLMTKPVSITSARIPVLGSVVSMPLVEYQTIFLSVLVTQVTQGILLSLASVKQLVSVLLI